MKQTALTLAMLCLTTSCTSPPQVQTPTGEYRKPINSEAAFLNYQSSAVAAVTDKNEKRELETNIQKLQKQVTDLKTFIILKAAETEINTPKGITPALLDRSAVPATQAAPLGDKVSDIPLLPNTELASAPVGLKLSMSMELVQTTADSTVFTVTHPVGKTEFAASNAIKTQIVQAAKNSKRIEIRGRTDAIAQNALDRRVAVDRAIHAFNFLVAKGVPRKNIRVTYQSAGYFAVENGSDKGRARNRRVEIETYGYRQSSAQLGE